MLCLYARDGIDSSARGTRECGRDYSFVHDFFVFYFAHHLLPLALSLSLVAMAFDFGVGGNARLFFGGVDRGITV